MVDSATQTMHPSERSGYAPRVSVLVAFRNEAAVLVRLLESLKAQAYPPNCLMVVLVDDGSTDASLRIAQEWIDANVLQTEIPTFVLLEAKDARAANAKHPRYKKGALLHGIQYLEGLESPPEWIVQTDADCCLQTTWVRSMVTHNRLAGKSTVQMAAGMVEIRAEKPSRNPLMRLWAHFQLVEFAAVLAVGSYYIQTGRPAYANGANLAYRLTAFRAVDGWGKLARHPSGDDEFLLQRIGKNYGADSIRFIYARKALVTTDPIPSVRGFLEQRVRWASKGRHYHWLIRGAQTLVWVLNFGIAFGFVLSFFFDIWTYPLIFWLQKYLIELIFLCFVWPKMGYLKLMPFHLLYQPIHVVYVVVVGLWAKLGGYSWKGRKF